MSSHFGTLFQVSTWGESHGPALGVVVQGCPAGLALTAQDIQRELDRRRPGQSAYTSPRQEADTVQVLSGVYQGYTLGTPIALVVPNHDARPADYTALDAAWRPSHADFTYEAKYGVRFPTGGGRASARETLARVAAGAIAKKILQRAGIPPPVAYVARVGAVGLPPEWLHTLLAGRSASADTPAARLLACPQALAQQVESNPVRCPCPHTAAQMQAVIHEAKEAGDSLGGLIVGCAYGVPAGLGEPVFDKLEADLAKALLSIPATKSFELGSGLEGTYLRGSAHNDAFVSGAPGAALPGGTATNRSGGIQGGISNGELVWLRLGFKPTATVAQPQATVGRDGTPTLLSLAGRHDPCVLPRAVPIVEAMMALVLADHYLRHRALSC